MRSRKLTRAEKIAELSASIDTKETFLESAKKKAIDLNETRKTRRLSKAELKTLDNLTEFIQETTAWLIKSRKELHSA